MNNKNHLMSVVLDTVISCVMVFGLVFAIEGLESVRADNINKSGLTHRQAARLP